MDGSPVTLVTGYSLWFMFMSLGGTAGICSRRSRKPGIRLCRVSPGNRESLLNAKHGVLRYRSWV
eukprot:CAMPEP_0195027998 /NCGR_PEP_ID=MMETSP0326_2-20130528/53485_1 /TAXON_ID=2866 ORGANISM="Crypthecodinium cohnii, Strain Seligo" /NCGR_SAMPLE_ID=MMETSP0326_2 /ASSEMBLY_ACC=CAM_ASM_000348 /LENGTH=64 /DNA_ID=CAMNT_0040050375 /DNA_START=101 /DNA_END=295 /DNA_ORIENTATION=-